MGEEPKSLLEVLKALRGIVDAGGPQRPVLSLPRTATLARPNINDRPIEETEPIARSRTFNQLLAMLTGGFVNPDDILGNVNTAGVPLSLATEAARFYHASPNKFTKFRLPNYAPGEYERQQSMYLMPGLIHTATKPDYPVRYIGPGGYLYEVELTPKNVIPSSKELMHVSNADIEAIRRANNLKHGEVNFDGRSMQKAGLDGLVLDQGDDIGDQVAVNDASLVNIIRRMRIPQPRAGSDLLQDDNALQEVLRRMFKGR